MKKGIYMEKRNLNDYTEECYSIAKEKGWYDSNQDTIFTKLLLVHAEISEAVEELRKGKDPTEIYFSEGGKPEGFPIEIIDAYIRMFDLCKKWNVDLDKAYQLKTEYNKSRPYRHGKKV